MWKHDAVHDAISGLPAYNTANHIVLIVPLPPERERLPGRLYLHPDGQPADAMSRYLLERDACDYLTVWHGRHYREPEPPAGVIDFAADLEGGLARFNAIVPPELEPLPRFGVDEDVIRHSRGGMAHDDAWKLYVTRHASRERRHRLVEDLPPSDFHRFIQRRVAFVVGRRARDPLCAGMAAALIHGDYWEHRLDDELFRVLLERYSGDELFRRRLHVLIHLAARWNRRRGYAVLAGKPRDRRLRCGRRRCVFRFPPYQSPRPDTKRATQLLLLVSYVNLHQGLRLRPLPAYAAAVSYEARHFLISPKAIVRPDLTQEMVASHFGVTRRELQSALRDIRQPDYTDRIFEKARARTLRFPQRRRRQ